MAKTISFLSRNQQVLSSSLIITTGKKTSTVKDLNKLKLTNFSEKAMFMVVSGANERVTSIPPTQEYPDLQDISTSHHMT